MNTNNQFSINLSEGWEDQTVFTYLGPTESGVQHNLIISVDPDIPKKIDVRTYAYMQLGTSRIQLPGFVMLKEDEKILRCGIEGFEAVYKYRPSNEKTVYQKQLFLTIEGKGYAFTSTFSKKTMQTFSHEVNEMIESFIPSIA